MKKVKVRTILIAVWISLFLMILISAASAQDTTKVQKAILTNQIAIMKNQDTMMKNQDSIMKRQQQPPQRKLTDEERKKQEYMEWQGRANKIDKSIEQLDKQSMKMDSMILKGKKK